MPFVTIYLGSDVGLVEGHDSWREMFDGVDRVTLVVHAVATRDLSEVVGKAQCLLATCGSAATLTLGDPPDEVRDGHLLYLAGGNTFTLLDTLRRRGLMSTVARHVAAGRVYGGSAGALVLGDSIAAARRLDIDELDLRDLRGLDALGGYSVYPHWAWHSVGGVRWPASTVGVVELRNGAVLRVDHHELTSVGTVPVRLRRRWRAHALELAPGCAIAADEVGWAGAAIPA